MKESLAVPVETSPRQGSAWSTRIQKIAAFASEQCRSRDTVHSAICTITGSPEQLVINLACTAKSEDQVSELMQYVNDTLLPQMETALGVRFEVKNLQFAVAGKESLLAAPEHAPEAELPAPANQRDIAQSDIGGPGLWLRAEPDHDPRQADALAAILAMELLA